VYADAASRMISGLRLLDVYADAASRMVSGLRLLDVYADAASRMISGLHLHSPSRVWDVVDRDCYVGVGGNLFPKE
jgi:CobQ-like glutamine amidotransferase family enzyme